MLRFSLRTMAVAVTLIALACGAMINANAWIASTAWTVMFLILSLAAIAALVRTPRAFWMGFAVMGWLYVLAVMGPFAGRLDGLLLTTKALNHAAARMSQPTQPSQQGLVTTMLTRGGSNTLTMSGNQLWNVLAAGPTDDGFSQAFVQIGEAFWTLLLALVGGAVGTALARGRQAQSAIDGAMPPASPTLN